jgi:hypothetical protein
MALGSSKRGRMAKWKRVTRIDGVLIDINMDRVAYMYPSTAPENQTTIVFDFAQADRLCMVVVKEAPAQIHQKLDEYST